MAWRLWRLMMSVRENQRISELLVALTLFYLRIYHISRKQYERLFLGKRDKLTNQKTQGSNKDAAPQFEWQWPGFPRLPVLFDYYQHVSNSYMLYVVVRNVFLLNYLNKFVQLSRPSHCYLIGYFHIHPELSHIAGTGFSAFHLIWRAAQARLQRPYFISMFYFLAISEQDLECFEKQLELENSSNVLNSSSKKLQPCDSSAERMHRFFKQVLCYKIEDGQGISYKLRPNRTRESRRILRKQIEFIVVFTFCLIMLYLLTTFFFAVRLELSDEHYLARYPKCDLELEQLVHKRHELGGEIRGWTYSMYWHQLLTLVADLCENVIIWSESCVAVALWTTIYNLNYDSHLQWRHLDRELRQIHLRVQTAHLNWIARGGVAGTLQVCANCRRWFVSSSEIRQISSDPDKELANDLQAIRENRTLYELERDVRHLEAHLRDFFQQLGATDLLISDIITYTLLIWLSSFSVGLQKSLDLYTRNGSEYLDLISISTTVLGLSLLVVTVGSFAILRLHRNCLRAYTTLSSLIAYDRSENKARLAGVLEFYMVERRSAYTILQHYPYTKSTYLSIFGWSFSCLLIFDRIARH